MGNHLYELGDWLFISNTTIKDKSTRNFYPMNLKSNYNFWGSNKNLDLKHPIVLDLLKSVIPEKASQTAVMDVELTEHETSNIKKVFEREILRLLTERKPAETGYTIDVFGKELLIDTRNQIYDMDLRAFNDIYNIALECLEQNKPMYLSID